MDEILYHGGSDIIRSPEIREPERTLDFGKKMKAITPEQLYLILPYKVSQLSMLIARKFGMPILDAIRAVYRSNTYRDLEWRKLSYGISDR